MRGCEEGRREGVATFPAGRMKAGDLKMQLCPIVDLPTDIWGELQRKNIEGSDVETSTRILNLVVPLSKLLNCDFQ